MTTKDNPENKQDMPSEQPIEIIENRIFKNENELIESDQSAEESPSAFRTPPPKKAENGNFEIASPETLKIINQVPSDVLPSPGDNTEMITGEAEKIENLLKDNQSTIREYNKKMKFKHKSQLEISGLTNVSEWNNSRANVFQDTSNENTVLFGRNFDGHTRETNNETRV